MTWYRLSIQGSLVGVMRLSGDKDLMCSQLSSPGQGGVCQMFYCPLSHQLLRGWALCSQLLHLGDRTEGGLQGRDTREPGLRENCYPAPSGSVTRALASHMPCSRLDFRNPLSWERPWASELWRRPEDQLLLASTFSTPALWIFTGPSAPLEARPGHSRG